MSAKYTIPVKKQKLDRRVQRTRDSLREALMALVLEKGYEAVTVQDILDRANLGRSTFYSHFRDKDELLISGLDHLKQIFEEFDSKAHTPKPGDEVQRYSPVLLFLRHAAQHHRVYRSLLNKPGGEIVQRYLYKYTSSLLGRHLKHFAPHDRNLTVPRDLLIHHVVSSFLSLLSWWLEHNIPYSAEEMNEIYMDLTVPMLNAVLRKTR